MRITEFLDLDEDAVGQAIGEVVDTIGQDSPGCDHARPALPGTPTHRLLCILAGRAAARAEEYGDEVGFAHGMMMAFRIGAAYGRRVLPPGEESAR